MSTYASCLFFPFCCLFFLLVYTCETFTKISYDLTEYELFHTFYYDILLQIVMYYKNLLSEDIL